VPRHTVVERPSRSVYLGLSLWGLAVAAALVAQRLLTPERRVEQGALLYVFAAALAVIGVGLIDRGSPPQSDRDGQATPGGASWPWTKRRPLSLLLALLGVAAVGYSTYLVAAGRSPELANGLWAVGLGYVALSAWRGRVAAPSRPSVGRRFWIEAGILAAILALSFGLRLVDLAQIPARVHGDEAAVGLWARRLLYGEIPSLFGVGWYNLPILSFAPSALAMRLFGDDLFGLRVASVAQGVLSVLFLYLLARRLFSVRVAAIAAFLFAVSQFAVHYGRIGINYAQAELAVVLFLYLLVEAVERRSPVLYVLAGLAGGLCLEVYFAARVAPLLAAAYLLHRVASERGFLARQWRGLLVVGLAVFVFIAPFGVAYFRSPQIFISRAQGVTVLSEASLKHEYYAYKVDTPAEVLKTQVIYTLEAFNLRGESSLQYGRRGPLLDFATSALFVLGVAIATCRPRGTRYFFVAAWLWLTLLFGSVLTVDALFSPHVVVAIPVLFVFPALAVDAGWRAGTAAFGRPGRLAFLALALALAGFALRDNYREYFEVLAAQQPADFFTTLAGYSISVDGQYQVYLLGRRDTSLGYDTFRFLAPSVSGVDVRDKVLDLPLKEIPDSRGIAFVIEAAFPDGGARLDALREAYPGGRLESYATPGGAPLFSAYLVEQTELRSAIASRARGPGLATSASGPGG
jgi:dolichyl-phosphate-mannose-protein mannosyltransferase